MEGGSSPHPQHRKTGLVVSLQTAFVMAVMLLHGGKLAGAHFLIASSAFAFIATVGGRFPL